MSEANGKEVAETIKRDYPDLPIILMTGYGELVAKEDTKAWGVEEILLKPFNIRLLSDSISQGLKAK